MLKSMTGYGFYTLQDDLCTQKWEIKSVNAKQLKVIWNIPRFLRFLEAKWDKTLRSYACRGRVEVYLNLHIQNYQEAPVVLNHALAKSMLQQLKALAVQEDVTFKPDLNQLLQNNNIWQETDVRENEQWEQRLGYGLQQVLQEWDGTRIKEARDLREDLVARIKDLQQNLSAIKELSSGLVENKFSQLQERLDKFFQEAGSSPDRERMLQEMALLADRLDVSEELTRLVVHLQRLNELLHAEDGGGRKLDFLLQECFREINTCGNKVQEVKVSRIVVDCKAELEKIREQVQNLE